MDELILMSVRLMGIFLSRKKRRKRWLTRRWWTRPLNLRRKSHGDYEHLFQELKEDASMFFHYTRMDLATFYNLLNLVGPHLKKNSIRAYFPPEFRLAITLRFLATGDQISSLALAYRIGISSAYEVIKETCAVLANVLAPVYLCLPTEEEWQCISSEFLRKWNLPGCIGAVDGKHVQIQAPINSGSEYFNYKKTHSLILMAICDANYKFLLVDIGVSGSNSDNTIYSSYLGRAIKEDRLNIPRGVIQLPGSHITTPYYFVGDAAFQLSRNMMRPYPGRNLTDRKIVFNYRLSRARRTIENAFGILAARWRIYRKPISLNPDAVNNIILATVCLHNFLITENNKELQQHLYCPPTLIDQELENGDLIQGEWRNEPNILQDISNIGPHRATTAAYEQRDILADYLLTPNGEVPWQIEYIRRGRHAF
ncbi:hypothetical protein NQ315_004961 [Exocentrus adspersus]|uniref:DDE Tnp4 domain-containing protein n=1 Tax=Exocentrus adspersus TaxID=1586481 RepID=A0AAV8V7D5_9CUCU|nr:hypothetical protein NQ315_004961 [Exocentrus adspersus]